MQSPEVLESHELQVDERSGTSDRQRFVEVFAGRGKISRVEGELPDVVVVDRLAVETLGLLGDTERRFVHLQRLLAVPERQANVRRVEERNRHPRAVSAPVEDRERLVVRRERFVEAAEVLLVDPEVAQRESDLGGRPDPPIDLETFRVRLDGLAILSAQGLRGAQDPDRERLQLLVLRLARERHAASRLGERAREVSFAVEEHAEHPGGPGDLHGVALGLSAERLERGPALLHPPEEHEGARAPETGAEAAFRISGRRRFLAELPVRNERLFVPSLREEAVGVVEGAAPPSAAEKEDGREGESGSAPHG